MRSTQDPGHYSVGPGRVLELITTRQAQTRTAIAQATGLARSTVVQRLDTLFEANLIQETDERRPSKGRPSQVLTLNQAAGLIVAIDIGEDRTRIAVSDLNLKILTENVEPLPVNSGPEIILEKISRTILELTEKADLAERQIAGIGLGLPAPVDYEAGQVAGWSIMSGWDGFDIRGYLQRNHQASILIDNDVNLLTVAEHRRHWPEARHLLYVKAGTGIGSGMIVDGRINRGAQGAAGDIGHAHIPGYGDPLCRCGNLGCLEALVGGWALARDLGLGDDSAHGARDIAKLVQLGDAKALAALRAGGRILGEAVAYATSLLNPAVIVIGGVLATASDLLIAGVQQLIYQRSLPLATRQLRIQPTRFKSRAGIAGAAYLVLDHILDPQNLDQALLLGRSPFSR
jgi:predicted NBD/HSP70 family sugar kinase